ncbi:hypothetical protein ACJMK2_004940 [Sinanodonta woodiana]|uniref:Uncharacterized protein n=1 Tax=Sinanodonta woodiana TaxID=1069815 RepID=A0ABD3VNU3_SINWO
MAMYWKSPYLGQSVRQGPGTVILQLEDIHLFPQFSYTRPLTGHPAYSRPLRGILKNKNGKDIKVDGRASTLTQYRSTEGKLSPRYSCLAVNNKVAAEMRLSPAWSRIANASSQSATKSKGKGRRVHFNDKFSRLQNLEQKYRMPFLLEDSGMFAFHPHLDHSSKQLLRSTRYETGQGLHVRRCESSIRQIHCECNQPQLEKSLIHSRERTPTPSRDKLQTPTMDQSSQRSHSSKSATQSRRPTNRIHKDIEDYLNISNVLRSRQQFNKQFFTIRGNEKKIHTVCSRNILSTYNVIKYEKEQPNADVTNRSSPTRMKTSFVGYSFRSSPLQDQLVASTYFETNLDHAKSPDLYFKGETTEDEQIENVSDFMDIQDGKEDVLGSDTRQKDMLLESRNEEILQWIEAVDAAQTEQR